MDIELDDRGREAVNEAQQVATRAREYSIANAADYQGAAGELGKIKAAQKRLDELRKSMTRPIDEAKRRIMDLFRRPTEDLEAAERAIKQAMVTYQREQERIRLEEQRKADEAARKERERLAAQAAKAAEAGKAEKAAALEQRAEMVTAPVISRPAPKVEGIATREVWRFAVEDASKVPDQYKTVDEKKIGGVVRALKGDTQIPGVRVWREESIAARSA